MSKYSYDGTSFIQSTEEFLSLYFSEKFPRFHTKDVIYVIRFTETWDLRMYVRFVMKFASHTFLEAIYISKYDT